MALRSWFRSSFPNPVNETSARLVAAGVVAQAVVFLVVREWWVLVPLAYGFVARVLAGPRFSPLGRVVTQVVTPRLRVGPVLLTKINYLRRQHCGRIGRKSGHFPAMRRMGRGRSICR